jgi:hypothetical protein
LAVVPDQQNGAGQAILCDGLRDHTVDRRPARKRLLATSAAETSSFISHHDSG